MTHQMRLAWQMPWMYVKAVESGIVSNWHTKAGFVTIFAEDATRLLRHLQAKKMKAHIRFISWAKIPARFDQTHSYAKRAKKKLCQIDTKTEFGLIKVGICDSCQNWIAFPWMGINRISRVFEIIDYSNNAFTNGSQVEDESIVFAHLSCWIRRN